MLSGFAEDTKQLSITAPRDEPDFRTDDNLQLEHAHNRSTQLTI